MPSGCTASLTSSGFIISFFRRAQLHGMDVVIGETAEVEDDVPMYMVITEKKYIITRFLFFCLLPVILNRQVKCISSKI